MQSVSFGKPFNHLHSQVQIFCLNKLFIIKFHFNYFSYDTHEIINITAQIEIPWCSFDRNNVFNWISSNGDGTEFFSLIVPNMSSKRWFRVWCRFNSYMLLAKRAERTVGELCHEYKKNQSKRYVDSNLEFSLF